jgi:hypothetical protein
MSESKLEWAVILYGSVIIFMIWYMCNCIIRAIEAHMKSMQTLHLRLFKETEKVASLLHHIYHYGSPDKVSPRDKFRYLEPIVAICEEDANGEENANKWWLSYVVYPRWRE